MSAVAAHRRDIACSRCGADVGRDQDWCLECGYAARTRIVAPPDLRLPVALGLALVTAVVIGLVAGVLALLS